MVSFHEWMLNSRSPLIRAVRPQRKAMHKTLLLLFSALVTLCSPCFAVDLEALSKSPLWQVRYCVSAQLDAPSAEARRLLERLSLDEVPAVAQQSFAVYSRMFVELDSKIVKQAFARGDFDLVGGFVADREAFATPDYWIRELNTVSDARLQARAVRAIGMCGTAVHASKLTEHLATANPYLLTELALAFHRLGDTQNYLAAIGAILALPLNEALSYQTYAIDCLIQTHPGRARPAWSRVHEQFGGSKDVQPNWVYSHVVQEARLP